MKNILRYLFIFAGRTCGEWSILVLLCCTNLYGQKNVALSVNDTTIEVHNVPCAKCEDKKIIAVLKDEPAYVYGTEEIYSDAKDVALKIEVERSDFPLSLVSCNDFGLLAHNLPILSSNSIYSVKISGNVTSCKTKNDENIVEITDMKRNRDICDYYCGDSNAQKYIEGILTDVSASVRKTENFLYPYYLELTTYYDGLAGITLIPCEIIPNEFRYDGMQIKITGNIKRCYFVGVTHIDNDLLECHNFVELISIKK
jgi:hypothetical protein